MSCDETNAPLASEEDLHDNTQYSVDHCGSYSDCADDMDVKKGLLRDVQNENECSVIVKQPRKDSKHTPNLCSARNSCQSKEDSYNDEFHRATRPHKEISKTGAIGRKLYWKYVHAGASPFGIIILAISTIASHASFRFADSWLGVWTNNERMIYMHNLTTLIEQYNTNGSDTNPKMEEFNKINEYYLVVFCLSVLAMIVFCYLMIYRFFIMCINASRNLHNQMFTR